MGKRIFLPHLTFSFFVLSSVYSLAQKSYFQQEVNFTIHVHLDDSLHYLNASEKIEYFNHSPDTLYFLYFHLWPNAYQNNKTALAQQLRENGKLDMEFLDEKDAGKIDSLNFSSGGTSLIYQFDSKHKDICKVFLNKPLFPEGKIEIETPFRVKIPSALISRLGHIQQAYAITQWYPKPAVYDNEGWHPLPYLDQGEFYSEFGKFDVFITLPKNYVVGATGDLVNAEEELKWLNSKVVKTFEKIDKRNLFSYDNKKITDSMDFPLSSKVYKTLHYHQENVHDFAWFADKRFNVLKGEIYLPGNNKKVTCWSMFTDQNFDEWTKSIQYIKDAIYYYSFWNGDYAYQQVTAVDGTISAGGGMEYPNVTIIGQAGNDRSLETVIVHEVGHNWFYGMLGSNERKYAWMDEGINSFNELRYIRTKYPNDKLGKALGMDNGKILGINEFNQSYQYYLLYLIAARENKDQPVELNAEKYTSGNYGAIVYSKTAIVFDYLFHYLGEKKFDEIMQFYFSNFRFRHPNPHDLQKTFEYFTGNDLTWAFSDLIGTTKKLDYKIVKVKSVREKGIDILIKNTGEINSPLLLGGLKNEQLKGVIWHDGFKGKKWLNFPPGEIDKLAIDPWMCMPEINRKNNTSRIHGLFKKTKPIEIKLIGGIENPKRYSLYYFPVAAFNTYNGWMAGVYFHNSLLPEKKIQWDIVPLYGFGNKTLAGLGNVSVQLHPEKIQSLKIGSKFRRFGYDNFMVNKNYHRIENSIIIDFKKKNPRNQISHQISFHHIYINEEKLSVPTILQDAHYHKTKQDKNFAEIRYKLLNSSDKNKFTAQSTIQSGGYNNFIKESRPFVKAWIEVKYHITTNKKNNGWDLRGFAGYFMNPITNIDTRFRMNGITGNQDYTYSYLYTGRNESYSPHPQIFAETDGGFKTRMFVGQSSNYLMALNIKTPRILKYFGLFADVGTCEKSALLSNSFLFDAGINIDLLQEVINIYIPLTYSEDIKKGIEANQWNIFQRIMINIRIDKMNPKFVINNLF